jgi:hypothetical protein
MRNARNLTTAWQHVDWVGRSKSDRYLRGYGKGVYNYLKARLLWEAQARAAPDAKGIETELFGVDGYASLGARRPRREGD